MRRGGVDESRSETVLRRLRTIPPLVLGLLLVTALLPALLVVGLAIGLERWAVSRVPPTAMRLALFLWVYLAAEVAGLVALVAAWVASGGGRRDAWLRDVTWRLQEAWAAALFGAVRALFGIRIEVMGGGEAVPGPVIVLVRHASIVDNLLSANLIARPHRIRLRYVLKRELLADPCLDVAGRRLPNYFVRPGTGEARELERVRALANGLGSDEGVLIYPEGTRFTPRAVPERLAASPNATHSLRHGPSACATCCRRDSAASGRCSTAPRRRQSRPRRPSRPRLSEQAFFQSNRAVDVDLGFASKRTH